ncbi:MAG: hypothetical protein AAFZ07_02595 [Actinomycetota bacterium]
MRGRFGGTALLGSVIGVMMVLLGMEPRLVLVGLIVVAVAATGFLLVDLTEVTAPVDWHRFQLEEDTRVPVDWRVQQLRGTLLRSTTRRRSTAAAIAATGRTDQVLDSLVGVVDDLLFTEHGIDHAADPAAAAEIVGPELARLLADPAAYGSMSHRELDRIVTLVERVSAAHDGGAARR